MRTIKDLKGNELAVILNIQDYVNHAEKRFYSKPEDSIQVGSLFFDQYSEVPAHLHKPKTNSRTPMEVLLVLYGSPTAEIYDADKKQIAIVELSAGDVLIQKSGGHGFQFLHKAMMLEIKSGPYHGKESDKEMI